MDRGCYLIDRRFLNRPPGAEAVPEATEGAVRVEVGGVLREDRFDQLGDGLVPEAPRLRAVEVAQGSDPLLRIDWRFLSHNQSPPQAP